MYKFLDKKIVRILFLICLRKHMLWVLIRNVTARRSNEYPNHTFSCNSKKNIGLKKRLIWSNGQMHHVTFWVAADKYYDTQQIKRYLFHVFVLHV